MHIYVFVHFSEASLGIEPHFDFFRTLYKLVPLPFSKMLDRVGCTHLELQEKVAEKYLVFSQNCLERPQWPYDWFYIRNPSTGLPRFSAEPAEWLKGWYLGSITGCPTQVSELLDRAVRFQKMGVMAASVVWNYVQCQIQPLQRRMHFGFQYQWTKDVDRLSAEPIDRT